MGLGPDIGRIVRQLVAVVAMTTAMPVQHSPDPVTVPPATAMSAPMSATVPVSPSVSTSPGMARRMHRNMTNNMGCTNAMAMARICAGAGDKRKKAGER